MLQLDTRRTTCRVKEVYKSSQTPPFPLLPWLRSCLDLLCDVQVSVLQCCFAPDVCKIQRPLNLSCPTPTCIYFDSFGFQSVYIWLYFYLSEAMIIPGCCSQSLLCSPPEQLGDWLGTSCTFLELRTYWLVSFCGSCVIQLVLYVSPVEQSASNMAWKPFATPIQTWCEEDELLLRINLSPTSCLVDRNITVKWLPYLCLYSSSLQAWYESSCFGLVHEVAAAREGSSCFKSCMGHFLHQTPQ